MVKILNTLLPTQTSKAYETGNYLYFNGVAYNKETMSSIPFIPFTNGDSYARIIFNSMVTSKIRTHYWNTRLIDGVILDNKTSGKYFLSELQVSDGNVYSGAGSYLIKYFTCVQEKEKVVGRGYAYPSDGYYRFGMPITKIIGQSDNEIYCIFLEGGYASSSSSSVSPYPPTSTGYPIKASIGYLDKRSISQSGNPYMYSITGFSKSNGEIQVLQEDNEKIVIVVPESGYKYSVVSISKANKTSSVLQSFQALDDSVIYKNSNSTGVASTEFKKIAENKYQGYISGEKTITGDDGNTTYENVLSRVTINLEDNTSEVKNITTNNQAEFNHSLALYYNNITLIEEKNKKFLVTTSYITGSNSIPSNLQDKKAIQLFELNETDEDNITATEVYFTKYKNMNGSFQGFLFSKKDNLFLVITDKTTLFYNFNLSEKNLRMLDTGLDHHYAGMDINGNFYIQLSNYEVHYFNAQNIYNFNLEVPDDEFIYEGTPIDSQIKISAKNIKDEFLELDVRLVIVGDAKFKNEDSQTIITKTQTSGVKEIPISITGGGRVKVIPYVKL